MGKRRSNRCDIGLEFCSLPARVPGDGVLSYGSPGLQTENRILSETHEQSISWPASDPLSATGDVSVSLGDVCVSDRPVQNSLKYIRSRDVVKVLGWGCRAGKKLIEIGTPIGARPNRKKSPESRSVGSEGNGPHHDRESGAISCITGEKSILL